MDSSQLLQAVQKVDVEDVLLPVLVQLVIIILAARVGGLVARRLGQAAVVGETLAGLLLGPSLLGRLPAVHRIFHPAVGELPPELADQIFRLIFAVLSQLGLIFLLFLVGLEFDFSHLRRHGKGAILISLGGLALPFTLGVALAPFLLAQPDLGRHPQSEGAPPTIGFTLFLGISLSITAMPVLARIMMELGITRTRLGTITITAAAGDDAMGWILLASIAAVVRSEFELGKTLFMILATTAFALAMIFLARPLLRAWLGKQARAGELGITTLAAILSVLFVCAIATNLIGIFAVFGAFLLGACLSRESELHRALHNRLRDFVSAFFVPIFFTYTGLRTDIGNLETPALWVICVAVLAAAIFGKLAGCWVAARMGGFSPREAGLIGILMNTRGLMELIVINVGYELRVIPPSVYCMLVLMAVVTTVMTTPLVTWLRRGTELEEAINAARGFTATPTHVHANLQAGQSLPR